MDKGKFKKVKNMKNMKNIKEFEKKIKGVMDEAEERARECVSILESSETYTGFVEKIGKEKYTDIIMDNIGSDGAFLEYKEYCEIDDERVIQECIYLIACDILENTELDIDGQGYTTIITFCGKKYILEFSTDGYTILKNVSDDRLIW